MKPEVLDNIDADKWAETYSDMLGVDPELIVPSDKVALIRQDRAKMAQQQAKQEAMAQGSQVAKNLAGADTSGQNALTDVMGMFSGYNQQPQ